MIERQKNAEATKFEQEKDAEALKIKADAKRYEAEQEAEGIRLKGSAEAEAIRAKGIAEAEAMSKMKEAAILEMYFNALPKIAESVAKPLQSIDKITMYGEGNTAKLVEDITKSTTQISEGFTQRLGIDLKSMLMGAIGTKALSNLAGNTTVQVNTESEDKPERFPINPEVAKMVLGIDKDDTKEE